MCRATGAGGRRCTGPSCAESRRARQRAYTARVRAWKREERAALAEIDDEQTRQLLTEALRSVVLTPDERSHLRAKRITRIKRQAHTHRNTNPDPNTLTDETQPAPDAETIKRALLADPENAADLARALARRDDLTPTARSVVAAATAADDAGGADAVPFLDRGLAGAEARSPADAAARGRAIGAAAREFGMARDAEERVDAAAQHHDTDTGGESPAVGLRGGPGDSSGGDRPGGSGGSESGRLDRRSGVPGGATPGEQRQAAEQMVDRVRAARSAGGRPFIPSPGDVAAILRRLLGIGSKLSPKLIVLLAARAVGGLITGDDSGGQVLGADGSGTVWLSMDQADIGDIEQHVTDPRAECWTVGPATPLPPS